MCPLTQSFSVYAQSYSEPLKLLKEWISPYRNECIKFCFEKINLVLSIFELSFPFVNSLKYYDSSQKSTLLLILYIFFQGALVFNPLMYYLTNRFWLNLPSIDPHSEVSLHHVS